MSEKQDQQSPAPQYPRRERIPFKPVILTIPEEAATSGVVRRLRRLAHKARLAFVEPRYIVITTNNGAKRAAGYTLEPGRYIHRKMAARLVAETGCTWREAFSHRFVLLETVPIVT